jgi:hypothetical protein
MRDPAHDSGSTTPRRAPSALDRPLSRPGCLLAVGLWLCVMTLPLAAVILAMRGELTWRRGPFTEDRLWLVHSAPALGQGDEQGLGYSAARVIANPRAASGAVCVRTRVYFWLWRGKSETLEFCDCYLPASGGGYAASGGCP